MVRVITLTQTQNQILTPILTITLILNLPYSDVKLEVPRFLDTCVGETLTQTLTLTLTLTQL